MTNPRWFVVHTKGQMRNVKERLAAGDTEEIGRSEWVAARHLRQQGYDVFCPWEWGKRRVGTKFVGAKVPYFPRYIFASLPDQQFNAVNNTPGVSTLLYLGPDPLEVPLRVIQALQARCDEDGRVIPPPAPPKPPELKIGDAVTVLLGGDEFLGKVRRLGGREVEVWLEQYERSVFRDRRNIQAA